ncbi:MAG: hypothetical protein ABUM51_10580, partial [Bacteroidota bacterium]
MQRRKFLINTLGTGLAVLGAGSTLGAVAGIPGAGTRGQEPGFAAGSIKDKAEAGMASQPMITSGPKAPLTIYNNWSSYDELSDNIPLT